MGRGLPQPDYQAAVRHYNDALLIGNLHAKYRLGLMFRDGRPGWNPPPELKGERIQRGKTLIKEALAAGYTPR